MSVNVSGDYDGIKLAEFAEELKDKIEELEAELEKCKEGCGDCDNKVECVTVSDKPIKKRK
jgi:hypothetical protein